MNFSPFDNFWQIVIVVFSLGYFWLTVIGFMCEDFEPDGKNIYCAKLCDRLVYVWFDCGRSRWFCHDIEQSYLYAIFPD